MFYPMIWLKLDEQDVTLICSSKLNVVSLYSLRSFAETTRCNSFPSKVTCRSRSVGVFWRLQIWICMLHHDTTWYKYNTKEYQIHYHLSNWSMLSFDIRPVMSRSIVKLFEVTYFGILCKYHSYSVIRRTIFSRKICLSVHPKDKLSYFL